MIIDMCLLTCFLETERFVHDSFGCYPFNFIKDVFGFLIMFSNYGNSSNTHRTPILTIYKNFLDCEKD